MKRYILALGIIISCFVSADASSLFGKVIAVNSGDVITISNLNRPVRVKLMGVDAPEMNQAFGEVAKKHLSDLVLEKSVIVEYAGIAADSSLTGRVLLNDADIGAQMIRDGAAWFEPVNGNRLSPTNREVYQQSELAARSEKRGLWQQEDPVAPWEFVKAEKMRINPPASSKEIVTETKPRHDGPAPELNNLTLMAARIDPAPRQPATPEMKSSWARSSARQNWTIFQPAGENFSVNVPEGGERVSHPQAIGDQMVDINVYMARDGWLVYTVLWFKGPTLGETDELAIEGVVKDVLKAAQGFHREHDLGRSTCKPRKQKVDSQNGFTAVEIDLTSCLVPTRMRIYTRVIDDQRQMYIGSVAGEQDENVMRFLKSFKLGSVKTRTR